MKVNAGVLRRGGLGGGYDVPRGGTPFGGAKSIFDGGLLTVVLTWLRFGNDWPRFENTGT